MARRFRLLHVVLFSAVNFLQRGATVPWDARKSDSGLPLLRERRCARDLIIAIASLCCAAAYGRLTIFRCWRFAFCELLEGRSCILGDGVKSRFHHNGGRTAGQRPWWHASGCLQQVLPARMAARPYGLPVTEVHATSQVVVASDGRCRAQRRPGDCRTSTRCSLSACSELVSVQVRPVPTGHADVHGRRAVGTASPRTAVIQTQWSTPFLLSVLVPLT